MAAVLAAFLTSSVQADLFVGSISLNTVLQYDETMGNFLADYGQEIPTGPVPGASSGARTAIFM
jgi:hypothetical protein